MEKPNEKATGNPPEKTEAGKPLDVSPCSSLIGFVATASISEHPEFRTPRNDWGVIPERWTPEYWDPETGECFDGQFVPEDRSGYRPDLDGMSLADMWYAEKQDWKIQPPGMEGITHFLRADFKMNKKVSKNERSE